MRVFADPNGSGKSTIIKAIQKFVTTGPYINADDIEKFCREKGLLTWRTMDWKQNRTLSIHL